MNAVLPYARTRTDRRKMARDVRWRMGTSREGPPTLGALLAAAHSLDTLLNWTTGGRYRLMVEKRDVDGQWIEPSGNERRADVEQWSAAGGDLA